METINRTITLCISDQPLHITNGDSVKEVQTVGFYVTGTTKEVENYIIKSIEYLASQVIERIKAQE